MSDEREHVLRRLVAGVEQAGLRTPVSLCLEMLSPIDVVSSQLVRFSLPFVSGTRAEQVALALGEPEGWRALRHLLNETSIG